MFIKAIFIIANKCKEPKSSTDEPNKQNVVYPSNRLFNHRKEWSTDTCYIDEPWKFHAKWKKPVTIDRVL